MHLKHPLVLQFHPNRDPHHIKYLNRTAIQKNRNLFRKLQETVDTESYTLKLCGLSTVRRQFSMWS